MVERWSFLSIYESCLIFEVPRKTIFPFSKKQWDDISFSMEYRFYQVKVLALKFLEMGIRSFFDPKSWFKVMFSLAWNTMFSDYCKFLVLNFWEIGNTVYFWKTWWKDDIYLVFLSFLWCSRTWEIWFLLQWTKNEINHL